jgi:hypothetical protein
MDRSTGPTRSWIARFLARRRALPVARLMR